MHGTVEGLTINFFNREFHIIKISKSYQIFEMHQKMAIFKENNNLLEPFNLYLSMLDYGYLLTQILFSATQKNNRILFLP